ncbi:uncharacterized protein LOC120343078 [Styela clava]
MKVAVLLLTGVCLLQYAEATYGSCDTPTKPYNGYVECPDGTGHFSMCVTKCNAGHVISGPSRQMCWCRGDKCLWKGTGAKCEQTNCDMPFFDDGRVYLADSWPRGFGGVVAFNKIPNKININLGWSIVIVFDRPLGKNASISSWNTEMSTASYDGQTFTLVNVPRNEDLSAKLRYDQDLSVLFVVNYVDGELPSAAYVGLYETRISDASCVLAPQMPAIKPVSASSQNAENGIYDDTQPSSSTTVPTTTITTTKSTTTKVPMPSKTKLPKKRKRPRYRYRRPSAKAKTTQQTTTTTKSTTTPSPQITFTTTVTTLPEDGRYCILQRNPSAYVSEKSWTDRGEHSFTANAIIDSPGYLNEWSMVIVFDAAVKSIEVWASRIADSSADGLIWTFGPHAWDSRLNAGEKKINFIATTREVISGSASGKVFLCSDSFTTGDALMMRPQDGGFPTLADGNEVKSRSKRQTQGTKSGRQGKRGGNKNRGGGKTGSARCTKNAKMGIPVVNAKQTPLKFKANNDGTKYNYNELLHKSILFYEAQRSGKLPANNRVPWRGNSGLKDGCDIKEDATGGWYDAGNFIKYNFPMAFSLTTLAWGGIVFRDAYEDAGEMSHMINTIKWGTRYLIKCHISKYEFIGQVGTPAVEDKHWGRPEEMQSIRKTFKITANKPGTELAAEAAAALAASSIFLKKTDAKLSAQALKHAKELYEFADTYRGMYHIAIPVASPSYESYSGYEDELVWSAAWLYKATNNKNYLKAAEKFYQNMKGESSVEDRYVWDRKLVGAQLLLAEMTGKDTYRGPLAKFLNGLETWDTTPEGMYFLDEWGPNRYTCGAAFIALLAGKLTPHLPREQTYLKWAEEQVGMILGDTGKSYVIGFGKNYPQYSTHKAGSCPPYPQTCDWGTFNSKDDNHYIIYGAMVGGTNEDGIFDDDRENAKGNHITIDFNANFQSAIAGLKHFAMMRRGKQPGPGKQPKPPTTKSPPKTVRTKPATAAPNVPIYPQTPATTRPVTSKISTTAKPQKTRPPVSEKVRCAKRSPNGVPVVNAHQTKLNFKPNNDGTKYNYNELLHKSILFYEVQRSGELPANNRIPWRGDSALKDGCDIKSDISGGWYDAASFIKYNFPMAFSLTTLAWGGITFRDAYEDAGEMINMIDTIKWGTRYLIKCHISKYEFVGQVGNPELENESWGRPEEMPPKRKTYRITATKPGSELAGEAAAALTASSLFLKKSNPELAKLALKHAKELYEFADTYRGMYHIAIPVATKSYKSYSGYEDELVWAAAWLYKATNEDKYLKAAVKLYRNMTEETAVEDRYVWDRKLVGAQLLLAEMTGNEIYKEPVAKFLNNLETWNTTAKGMYFLDEWGPNRYTCGAAFVALLAAKLKLDLPREQAYLKWAEEQVGKILGDTGRSFVIGFGKNFPQMTTHKAGSCPPYPQTCDLKTFDSKESNYYIIYGAMVGGTDKDGVFHDNRENGRGNHITLDFNANFQSAIAGLKYFAMMNRGKNPSKLPQPQPGATKPSKVTATTTRMTPATAKPTMKPKPTVDAQQTRPPISEKVRCARGSPNGVPVKNAGQTKLNFKPNIDGTKYNYNKALHLSILFFEAQMAGRLPPGHRIPWRGDSTLKDGCEVGADVSGGWFDAGDHVKFAFPMAFSLTTLAWGGIKFRDAYEDAGELQNMINTVQHGAEWFIKAHTAKYELIGQVGNGNVDHGEWGRPETMSMRRPVYKITAKKPGSELAGEAAAALAASSILLKATHPQLSREALQHAKELYDFANKYRGTYHKSIPDAKEFYASISGYDDELIWGAAWLYKATNDNKYLLLATNHYNRIQGKYVVETRYSWDRKLCGAQALLAELTGGSDYKTPFFKMIDDLMRAKTTPQGLHFLTKWGSNRYAAGAAFMAAIAGTMNAPRKAAYQKWAQKQLDLMLGDSGQSYLIGYGKYPKRPHHRSSSCPPYPQRCDWSTFNSPKPNHYILYGALVGGPDSKGKYLDKRSLYEQTEVTTDYNACFQSAAAGVKYFAMKSRRTSSQPQRKPGPTPSKYSKPIGPKKPTSGPKKPSPRKPMKKPSPKKPIQKPPPKKPMKKSPPQKPMKKPHPQKPLKKPPPKKPVSKHESNRTKVPCRPPSSPKCQRLAQQERQRRNRQHGNG